MNLDILVNKLINPQFLSKLFLLWIIVTIVASAVSVSFVANTPTIAAEDVSVNSGVSVYNEKEYANSQNTAGTDINNIVATALPDRIIIDSLNKDLPVVNPQTTDISVLDAELMNGAVRYPTSGRLGENGRNVVIFGHTSRIPYYRGMYRAFNDIERLTEGEVIVLQGGGKEYIYRVSDVYKKNAETDEVALGGKNSKLILITCDGFGKRSDRWIVEADFIGSYDL